MKKRKILAAGGIVTTLFIAGASQTFAQTTSSVRARQHSTLQNTELTFVPGNRPTLETIAANFGLNAEEMREDLRIGKTPKEILLEQGVSQAQIKKLFKRGTIISPKIKKLSVTED